MGIQESIQPLPVSDWPRGLDNIIADMGGKPINVHKLMAHNPGLLHAWWQLRNYLVAGGSLGKRRGELVILRVAIHMQTWYEWGSHVERALACGIREEEIERIHLKEPGADWDAAEALLLRAVDALVEQHRLPPPLLSELRQHFSDAEIMDVMAIQGMYVTLACMIRSWGLELDEHIHSRLPEEFLNSGVPEFT